MVTKKDYPQRITQSIAALKRGEFVILVDSEDRENEGDLVLAAEFATAEKINFLIRNACGLVCLSLTAERIDELGLPPMVQQNESSRKTAFTVSIEAKSGVSTGISAHDRARTILVAASKEFGRDDVVAPGHVFPLRAAKGGILERAGHTEGSLELCRMAGLEPAAVICEIINEDGTMARRTDLDEFAKKHSIPVVSIEELIEYRLNDPAIHAEWLKPSALVPFHSSVTGESELRIQSFFNTYTNVEHAVIQTQTIGDNPWVRIHSECFTGDVLGSDRCDCGAQLESALKWIEKEGDGLIIYLRNQEGRGIGLWNKMQAYHLQDQGMDTVEANEALGFPSDSRSYIEAAAILKHLGLKSVRLLTGNPQKKRELETCGIEVTEIVVPEVPVSERAQRYLESKRDRLGHWTGFHA